MSNPKVDIINAAFRVSDFIREAPKVKPLLSRDNMDNPGEFEGIVLSRGGRRFGDESDDEALLEGESSNKRGRKRRALWARMADAPYPVSHMLMLGGNGLLVSAAAIALGFLYRWNTLSAVSAALPCHMFALSFFVSEVEDGASQLVRLGLGFCGFYVAILVIACYSLTREFIGLIAAFLLLVASFWYVELCVKARGWHSWFQGLINLWNWFRGGCPLAGIRKPEPLEDIVVLGDEPAATAVTAFMTPEERHPGCVFKPPSIGMRVKHIGQCLQVLSEKGNPMGPWEEGIIQKKTARQLRKWLVRNGKKTDEDFKKWSKFPHGEIIYIGFVSGAMHAQVEWQDESVAQGHKKPAGYYQYGENGFYELVEYQDASAGPGAGLFDDQTQMHSGGSQALAIKTFLAYFARRFCAWLWYWIIFFAYFGMLYILEYSLASYSVYQAMGNAYPPRGKFYNVRPGNAYKIHIYCKGGTKAPWDGRPPVIMEAMEGIGSGVYLSRLQDQIAEYGVCCVYDRLGFGYSSDDEDSEAWADRSPSQIVSQLHFALTIGVDDTVSSARLLLVLSLVRLLVTASEALWLTLCLLLCSSYQPLQNPVSFEKPYIGTNGENLTEHVRVAPPYVLLAHSAGALYARKFAHDYPELVAGMVLVDPLPAEKLGNDYIMSQQQKLLSPLMMQLCQRFLQVW